MIKTLWIALCAVVLQGCALSPNALLAQRQSASHNFLATDSRVRVITDSELGYLSTTGIVDPKRVVCSEPSPDVATTVANSIGVGLSVLGQGSASLSAQSVEGLVQLGERTAAIQLLRDKMYQTCLAYSNGAITGTSYSMMMTRLDDSIITLSLGDNAAGAFGRKLAGVGGEASAKADATVLGLPGEVAKIEDNAAKLAAANTKVDSAEDELRIHKSEKAEVGKEAEYDTQTTNLEKAVAKAKAERNATLELLRGIAKTSTEAAGKIAQLQVGGSISGQSAGAVLRDMQYEFLLADSSRELVAACIVELGLRGQAGTSGNADLTKLTQSLSTQFTQAPSGETGSNYAGAILRGRDTALTDYCRERLPELVANASDKFHAYRMHRAQLNASVASGQFAGHADEASARRIEVLGKALTQCQTDFKDDAPRRAACLDVLIPIKAEVAK